MKNIRPFKIVEGWFNYGLSRLRLESEQAHEEVVRRAKICEGCEYLKQADGLMRLKDGIKEMEGAFCGDCGCPLVAKLRSSDKCRKW